MDMLTNTFYLVDRLDTIQKSVRFFLKIDILKFFLTQVCDFCNLAAETIASALEYRIDET